MKQTAVEWFYDELKKLIKESELTDMKPSEFDARESKLINQAKKLEKQQQQQDTLEDAYLNQLINEANKEFTLDRKLAKEVAIKFSKWQQERSCSEEEMEKIFDDWNIFDFHQDSFSGKDDLTFKQWFNNLKRNKILYHIFKDE